jgi:hypothetical protein
LAQGQPFVLPALTQFADPLGVDVAGLTALVDTTGYLQQEGARAAISGKDLLFQTDQPSDADVAHELVHAAQGAGEAGVAVAGEGAKAEQEADAAVPDLLDGKEVDLAATAEPGVHLRREDDLAPEAAEPTEAAEGTDSAGEVEEEVLDNDQWCRGEEMTETEAKYRDIVATGRSLGLNVAADLLEHYLDGSGSEVHLEDAWLKGFNAVEEAQERNISRFEEWIPSVVTRMKDGESLIRSDYWDATLIANPATELYYASGWSTVTSRGRFSFVRHGQDVQISGEVDHKWWDYYDWHAGIQAFLPTHGIVSDSDAKSLLQCGAREFPYSSNWKQTLFGTAEVGYEWFNKTDYHWEDAE